MDLLRFACAFFSGGLLFLSGSLIQGVSFNEISGPSTLGLNAACVLAIVFVQGLFHIFGIELSLEWSSLGIMFLVTILFYFGVYQSVGEGPVVGNGKEIEMKNILIFGLCFNLFVGAIFSVMQFFFINLNMEFPAGLWFGNFKFIPPYALFFMPGSFFVIYLISIKISKSLQIMSFGSGLAGGIGLPIKKVIAGSVALSLLCSAIVTCFFGVFAFLGILFPLLVRNFGSMKYDLRKEILYGPLIGGLIIALLDLSCANYTAWGAEIPVGMLSSLVGSI